MRGRRPDAEKEQYWRKTMREAARSGISVRGYYRMPFTASFPAVQRRWWRSVSAAGAVIAQKPCRDLHAALVLMIARLSPKVKGRPVERPFCNPHWGEKALFLPTPCDQA